MRLKILIVAVLLENIFIIQAQWYNRYYPEKQLDDLNRNELSVLYEKSADLRQAGLYISMAGIGAATIGSLIGFIVKVVDWCAPLFNWDTSNFSGIYRVSGGIIISGIVVGIIGVPVWMTGDSRMKEVNKRINFLVSDSGIALAPVIIFNKTEKNFIHGISISIRF